jgi:penicillin-binding protein 2
VGRISQEQYAERKGDPELRYGMNDYIGQAGLEATYETVLRGRPGMRTMEVDAAGREVRALAVENPIPGKSLKLAIDLPLQREMTRILGEELPQRQSMVGIAMDPRNGQVLAMVALPTYDNNLFVKGISQEQFTALANDPGRPLVNHAISDVYPPGSTFKMFTAAGGLQEGVVTEATQVYDPGFLSAGGARFVCWGVHLSQDMVSALANSCDTYFYTVGGGDGRGKIAGLGVDGIKRWAMTFGLGALTGIDLPNEQEGNVPDEEWKEKVHNERWYLGDTYNMSIGQGFVTATPIQIINGTLPVANGGTLYRPQIVLETLDETGTVTRPFQADVIRQIPVAPQHMQLVREGLRAGMTIGETRYGTKYYGTSWDSEVPDIRMAGKTGTAEYGYPDEKGKLASHGWFTAFAPLDNPEIAVLVFMEKGSGRFAANVTAKIMRWYFRVSPDKRGPGGY